MNESFIDTEAAARFLGLSPSTLNTLRSRGGGPAFHKFGRAVRYRQCDLLDYARGTRREVGDQFNS
jgi:hypothetical protein